MSRSNVDSMAYRDPRFVKLARRLGWANKYESIGRMSQLWLVCAESERYTLTPDAVADVLELPIDEDHLADVFVECSLAEWSDVDLIVPDKVRVEGKREKVLPAPWLGAAGRFLRFRGTRGRIEWLAHRRRSGAKGGAARSASSIDDDLLEADDVFASSKPANVLQAVDRVCTPPPAPALAPAPDYSSAAAAAARARDPARPDPERDPDPDPGGARARAARVRALWEYQEQLRASIPGLSPRNLVPGDEQRVLALLEHADEATIRGWLDDFAEVARREPQQAEYFDGNRNWDPRWIRVAVAKRSVAGAGAAARAAPLDRRSDQRLSAADVRAFARHLEEHGQ